ncbi:MAG: hypothetical protein ACREE4_09295 [Stellaceae bacterium]
MPQRMVRPPYRRIIPRPAHKPTPPPEPGSPAVTKPSQSGPSAVAAPPSPALQPGPPAAGATTPPAPLAAPPRSGALIGIDEHRAAQLFGGATKKIEQPPATIWRYKTPNCELDLFFYLDLRSGQMRTLHYAFKGDVDDTQKRQDCLRAIVAARGS